MSAPVSIDGAEFARQGENLEGRVPLATLARLHDVLVDTDGTVMYRLAGAIRRDGKPSIGITVAGTMRVTCQRCLQPVALEVDSSRTLVFVPGSSLSGFDDEEADTDYLPSEDRVSPMDLVVDELILAMPISPRHPEDRCPVVLPFVAGDMGGAKSLN